MHVKRFRSVSFVVQSTFRGPVVVDDVDISSDASLSTIRTKLLVMIIKFVFFLKTRRINHQMQLYAVGPTSIDLSLQLNTSRSQTAFNDGASDHRRSARYPFKMKDRSC